MLADWYIDSLKKKLDKLHEKYCEYPKLFGNKVFTFEFNRESLSLVYFLVYRLSSKGDKEKLLDFFDNRIFNWKYFVKESSNPSNTLNFTQYENERFDRTDD